MDLNQAHRALTRVPDAELTRLGVPEMHTLIRKLESEKISLASDHANLMKEVNKRMQVHLLEIRGLKEVNQRLQDESQELRDLCIFLDDDRQKSRKLAREWQRFGRYTSSVMKSEVSAYQEKLSELEQRQNELLKENIQLKELCIYLDDERNNSRTIESVDSRDQGDGSSISSLMNERIDDVTGSQEEYVTSSSNVASEERITPTTTSASISEHTTQYIEYLENHVKTLEDQLTQMDVCIATKDWSSVDRERSPVTVMSPTDNKPAAKSPSKPEAIVHAMKSLSPREQLDQISDGHYDNTLNQMELAVLKQMCQIAKRKLDKEPDKSRSHDKAYSSTDDSAKSASSDTINTVSISSELTNSDSGLTSAVKNSYSSRASGLEDGRSLQISRDQSRTLDSDARYQDQKSAFAGDKQDVGSFGQENVWRQGPSDSYRTNSTVNGAPMNSGPPGVKYTQYNAHRDPRSAPYPDSADRNIQHADNRIQNAQVQDGPRNMWYGHNRNPREHGPRNSSSRDNQNGQRNPSYVDNRPRNVSYQGNGPRNTGYLENGPRSVWSNQDYPQYYRPGNHPPQTDGRLNPQTEGRR